MPRAVRIIPGGIGVVGPDGDQLAGVEGEAAIVGVNSPARDETSPLVGNIRTMEYQDATRDQELPSEDNRIYFANESEALEAGYHRAGALNEAERQ